MTTSGVILKVMRAQGRDVIRSRWILVYTAFFLLLTEGVLQFAGSDTSALLTLSSASLMVIPLATLVLSTMYVYGAREFTELLLAQPISRGALYVGLSLGLALPMAGAFVLGVFIPFAVRGGSTAPGALAAFLLVGTAVAFAFAAIGFVIAVWIDDRLRGMAVAVGCWLLLAVAYDGLVLMVVAAFADHSLERPLLALMFANPVDLGRVLLLLRLDGSALMGYTGAVFEHFFAGVRGVILASMALVLWAILPAVGGARVFRRKDF